MSGAYLGVHTTKMVEAAGIEPLFPVNTNPMMSHDFGFYCVKTNALPRRFDSPGVPSSPLESSPPVPWSPPQSWRYFGDDHRFLPGPSEKTSS